MTRRDEEYLFECIEDIQATVHENNCMLRQICHVINVYMSRHNDENNEDFIRNVLANLISGYFDLGKFNGIRNK